MPGRSQGHQSRPAMQARGRLDMKSGSDIKPLVVCGPDGLPIDLVYENQKGFRKSIEQSALWSLHRESQKLLPYDKSTLIDILDKGSWYVARIVAGAQANSDVNRDSDDTRDHVVGSQHAESHATQESLTEVLQSLVAVIRQRNADRPAGSYTTHLFESGEAKIRKKLGEEAVEMLLASSPDEFVSETSDFLYHLLVLCEATGISLDDIARELKSRE